MNIPIPGRLKKRRNEYREIPPPSYPYRMTVEDLIAGRRPAGSQFFIKSQKTNLQNHTDVGYIESHKEMLRSDLFETVEWFNVDDPDGFIHCSCKTDIPVSVKMYVIMDRMADLGHISHTRLLDNIRCPECGEKTAVHNRFSTANTITGVRVGGLMRRAPLRFRLLRPLSFKEHTYGPDWFKEVDVPTMELYEERSNSMTMIGMTSSGAMMDFIKGTTKYADGETMEYMYPIPVKRDHTMVPVGEDDDGYYVLMARDWGHDESIREIMRSYLNTLRKDRVVKMYVTRFGGASRDLRFYVGEKYLSYGAHFSNMRFTWRDNIG